MSSDGIWSDSAETARRYIEARTEDLLRFASDLIAIPSPNPPGDETLVAERVQEELAVLRIGPAEVVAKAPDRPNLVLHIPGCGGHRSLLFNGHLDTKPADSGSQEKWRIDPLTPTIEDGHVHGLGSADMKGGVAALVYASAAVAATVPPVDGNLILTLVADEEAGGHGTSYLVDQIELDADYAIVGEQAGTVTEFEYLPIVARGTCYFRVVVYGTEMHASISDRVEGVNASVRMAEVLRRFTSEFQLEHDPHPLFPQGCTVTPGVQVDGGVFFGVNPGRAEFAVDVRIVPGLTPEEVFSQVELFLDRLRSDDPQLRVELIRVGGVPSASTLTGDDPFVRLLRRGAESVLGRELDLGGYPAYTDAYWLESRAGIPSIPAFGPGTLAAAHRPNESTSTRSIVDAAQIYALVAAEYLSGGPSP